LNDKWCSTTSFSNIAGLSNGDSILDTVSQFWIGCDSNIPLSLQQNIPNWTLDESGRFTLKSVKTFFLDPGAPCGWGKNILSSYIPPSKTLALWKVFHGRLPTDQHIHDIDYPGLATGGCIFRGGME